jgi:hypothetical protein
MTDQGSLKWGPRLVEDITLTKQIKGVLRWKGVCRQEPQIEINNPPVDIEASFWVAEDILRQWMVESQR